MKKEKQFPHTNTVQVGTETTVETFCADCNERIRTGRVIKPFTRIINETLKWQPIISVIQPGDPEPKFEGIQYKRSATYAGLKRSVDGK